MIPSINALKYVVQCLQCTEKSDEMTARYLELIRSSDDAKIMRANAHDKMQVRVFLEEQIALRETPLKKKGRK